VSRPTLYKWKNQLLAPEAPATLKFNDDSPPVSQRTELQRQVESLRRDLRQLQLDHNLLKKANELLKKGLSVDLPLLSNREKTMLVDSLRQTYALPKLFVELDLARSAYFYHRVRLHGADKYADARLATTEVLQGNHRCYGYKRLRAAVGWRQMFTFDKVVQRLMKQEYLVVAANRRRRYGSSLGAISPAPENLINRNFHAPTPNEKWLTDITDVSDTGQQDLPLAHDRLLRQFGGQLDHRYAPRRRSCEHHAGRCYRKSSQQP
jgi:putative transposase